MNSPIRGSLVLFPLVSAAGIEAALRRPNFVKDDTEIPPADSLDLLRAFSKSFPDLWSPFQTALGLDTEKIFRDSEKFADRAEPLPERIVPVNDADQASKTIAEFQAKHSPPMTQPIKGALRQTMRESKESQLMPSVGRMVQIMLSGDCNARQMLLELKPANELEQAIARIPTDPSEAPDPNSMFSNVRTGIKEVLDKTWPTIREVGHSEKYKEFREKHFSENPSYYVGRVNLTEHLQRPVPSDVDEFSLRSGGCLHAAQNEARLRQAPEVKLDHMFFSLLQEGLETTKFLEETGVDWRRWREELDRAIPTFEGEGPKFPPNARDLGMNMPDPRIRPTSPDLPEFLDNDRIEEWKTAMEANMAMARPRKFSDLLWLISCFEEPETLAYGYLTGAGITVEEVKAQTDSVY